VGGVMNRRPDLLAETRKFLYILFTKTKMFFNNIYKFLTEVPQKSQTFKNTF